MKRVFHLAFNKEADGDWYIEFPGYPFAHHNLMMVAGADQLCAYVAEKEGHPTRAVVDVTDCGSGFELAEGEEPPASETDDRGRGIALMRLLSDAVTIERRASGAGTHVQIVKLFPTNA